MNTASFTSRILLAIVLITLAIPSVAASPPLQAPVQVIGMSLDPTLLERAGITVADLKALVRSELKAGGVALLPEEASAPAARFTLAVPLNASESDVAVFILAQYQVLTPASPGAEPLYSTVWSAWWGARVSRANLPAELRRGTKLLVGQFLSRGAA